MTPDQIRSVVDDCARAVEGRYVFVEQGASTAQALRAHAGEGRYAGCAGPQDLAEQVTADLLAATGDLHLRLLFHEGGAVGEDDPEAQAAFWAEQGRRTAGGIRRVERRDGNLAVVEVGPVLLDPEHAGRAICAAMSLVADADALVLDVRGCRGGSPDGVVLLLSHLFGPEPVRLSDIESREDGTRQVWTVPVPAHRRFGAGKPVVVLVGPETFSGGEALAFDLKEQGRAVVVGRPTRGGAHPRVGLVVHPLLELTVPVARSVSLFTGGDWEGVGVQPDVLVPAGDDAFAAALEALRASGPPPSPR
ncbi:MAG TPA: S41 family peptidase [Pedococcus sp.]